MSETIERSLELLEARLHNTEALLQAFVGLALSKDSEALQHISEKQFMASLSLGGYKDFHFKDLESISPVSGGGTRENFSGSETEEIDPNKPF